MNFDSVSLLCLDKSDNIFQASLEIVIVTGGPLSRFIADLMSNTPRYQLARYNCSNVVAECLKVACDKDPSFHPTAHDYSRLGKILGRGIWTPNEILRYAREISIHGKAIA